MEPQQLNIKSTNQTQNAQLVQKLNKQQLQENKNTNHYNLNLKQRLLTNLIIYSSHNYPQITSFHQKIVNSIILQQNNQNNISHLYHSLQIIQQCLIKQLVYGPSFSHSPVHKLPTLIHQDMHFKNYYQIIPNQSYNNKLQYQTIQQLGLHNLIHKQQLKQLQWYSIEKFLKVASKSKTKKQIIKQLSLQGQSWIQSTPLSALFLILTKFYNVFIQKINQIYKQKLLEQDINTILHKAYLQRSRLSYLHNKILYIPVKQLSQITLNGYSKYLNFLKTQKGVTKRHYIQIMLQYSFSLTFYYKYQAGKKALQMARLASGLEIQYTGVLGRRTKYQSFDTAQLVMNLKDINTNNENPLKQQNTENEQETNQKMIELQKLNMPNPQQLILQQSKLQLEGINKSDSGLQALKYQQDSILLDVPKWLQGKQLEEVSIERTLIVLAAVNHYWHTVPKDQLSYQHVSTTVDTLLLQKNLTYPIRFCLLLLRSCNQFSRTKHFERALQQLNTLKDQYAEKSHERFQNRQIQSLMDDVFPTPYEPHLGFIKIVAEKMIQAGLVMSAVQLYQKVGMFEQCIDGLIKRNYKQRAMAMADKLLKQTGQTPRLLCMIGDAIKGDQCEKYFIKAWQLSGNKYPRAQKSLGWVYFSRKEYVKAAESFSKALSISYYQPGTWFTLGCTYMNLKQFPKALKAFSESICIDQSQGQAWANMASCYLYDDKIRQAYSTLEQAVKYSTRSWKIWSNLLTVALRVKQFYKYFESIEQLVMLDHIELITGQVLSKLVKIFTHKVQNSDRKMPTFLYYKRINNLYINISKKMAQLPIYWHYACDWNICLLDYFKKLQIHYSDAKKRDPNDLVSGYQTLQRVKATSEKNEKDIRQKIVQFKQAQLNMQMCIGWEQNKITGSKVRKIVPEYIEIYNKYNQKKEDINDFNLFIKGIKSKLQKCLEQKCDQIVI